MVSNDNRCLIFFILACRIKRVFIEREFTMFKKVLALFIMCIAFALPARAELKVDIIAGATQPISVAVQKFEIAGKASAKDAAMIREVVERDLKSTGLFRIANHDAFPEYVKMGDMPDFKLWSAIKAQVLVQAKLVTTGGQYKLEFYVWDVAGTEQIEAQSLISSKKSARRLARFYRIDNRA